MTEQTRSVGARLAAAVAVLVGVGLAVAGCSGGSSFDAGASVSPGPSANPTSGTTPPGGTNSTGGKGSHSQDNGVTGQITAENGTNWTVRTKAGKQIEVTVSSTTIFGSKKQPSTQDQFPVGATVRVAGATQDNAVTATRIQTPQPKTGSTRATAPATPTPTS